MKIGINAFGCNHGRSGIGTYVSSLIHNIPQGEHSVQVFGPQFDKYIYTTGLDPSLYEGVSVEDTEFSENLFIKTGFNQLTIKQKYDAVLYPAGLRSLPITFAKPAFLVIQELLYKEEGFSLFGTISKLSEKTFLQRATGIIACSNYIKQNLIDYGIPDENIKVIYNGIDTAIFNKTRILEIETKKNRPFAIRRPYILYASSISDKAKRHVELVKAFEIFKKTTELPHRLVIAGSEGKAAETLHRAVLASPYVSDIILAGYIEQNLLADFYAESDICVFPSEIEGVGLPVIEAMACGVPVACAKSGALPEIAKDAALFFTATNPEEIASVLARIATTPDDSTEALRLSLIEKGLDWVKRYDWKQTAKATIEYIAEKLGK